MFRTTFWIILIIFEYLRKISEKYQKLIVIVLYVAMVLTENTTSVLEKLMKTK